MAQYRFKSSTLYLFLLYSLIVFLTKAKTLTHSNATLCHEYERSALLHFKQTISLNQSGDSSAYPNTDSWKASSDCCSWDGVECDDKTGYVIGLHLSSSLLYATFHPNSTIFSLIHLQTLNLAHNYFKNSPIPPQISHLKSLSSLNLSSSDFSGQIPLELSGLSKLTSFDLSNNNLYGHFPIDIFHLPDLLFLDVSFNQNLTGSLPEFNQTSSLKELELNYTNFSGNLPVSIGNLQSLTRLNLKKCYFSGSIPASIGNLTQLSYLSFSYNMLSVSGKLSWLNKLTKLTLLGLTDTRLYGDIPPSLANLTQLTTLYLGHNHFSGEIPSWLMNMTGLTNLLLHDNELTGPIPSSFSQLKNLEILQLNANNLNGTVDSDIFLSLRNLTFLILSYNKITLLTHHHFNFTLPQFTALQLDDCNLKEIPYFLQFQNNLEVLTLRKNNIQGRIPQWIWNTSDRLDSISANLTAMEQNLIAVPSNSLRVIDISYNMLQGNLPIPPPNTIAYVVSNNRLTGDIKPSICGVRSLKILGLSNNNMSGQIPHCLGNSLISLDLGGNNFSGTIPQTYSEECNLKVMDLSQNQIGGQVPKSLSNCKKLQILDVSDNEIEDTFPVCLGAIAQLHVLILHSNKFHGAIGSPRNTSEFSMLRIVDLSVNSFTGDLPVKYIQIWNAMRIFRSDMEPYIYTQVEYDFGLLNWTIDYGSPITLRNKGIKTDYKKIPKIFTAIDLSSNKFTGKIPESFGSLDALQLLDLSNNELTGPIPPSLGKLGHLESLDLSRNKLSGVIPQQLATQLNFLSFFDVSYNLLSGPIPHSPHFMTFDNNSYVANSGLCGFPLTKSCRPMQSPPGDGDEDDSDSDDEFPSGFDWIFILAGVGSGIVVGFVMGNILTDRHPWLIGGILKNIGGSTQKSILCCRQVIYCSSCCLLTRR